MGRDYSDSFSCPNCRRQVSNYIRHYSIQNIIEIFKRAEVKLAEDTKNKSRSPTPTRVIESLNVRYSSLVEKDRLLNYMCIDRCWRGLVILLIPSHSINKVSSKYRVPKVLC